MNNNWMYYYKLTPEGDIADSNMLYTPTLNKDGSVMCMHYVYDANYKQNGAEISEELRNWFFERELRFLKELQTEDFVPTLLDTDLANKKIYIEFNKETLSQVMFTKGRNLNIEYPNWQKEIYKIVQKLKQLNYYKMALYPHCFFINKSNKLKTIDFYSVVPFHERFIERKIIESIIGKEGAYRFDNSTSEDQIDFAKFFEITCKQHLPKYWKDATFERFYDEIYA